MDQVQSRDGWVEKMIRGIDAAVDVDTHGSNERSKISMPPKALSDVRKESYLPQLLTIGPLLHDRVKASASVDRCKQLCVQRFMQRQKISDVKELMQRLFNDPLSFLKNHYSNGFHDSYSDRETLQLMLTLDTILIYEFFLFLYKMKSDSMTKQDIPSPFQILCKNEIINKQFFRDLFLMGNQIPMSFLMDLIKKFPMETPTLEKDDLNWALVLAIQEVDPFLKRDPEVVDIEIPDFCNTCSHLLDCLYVWVIKGLPQPPPKNKTQGRNRRRRRFPRLPNPLGSGHGHGESHKITVYRERLPTASQLCKAGIWFKAIEDGGISAMHYSKRSHRLDLPRIVVKDRTEDMLRNLLVHEQTSTERVELSKYVVVMDSLIDTAEDVAILTKARVIENHLGSDEELLKMWNGMCITVSDRPCETWDHMIHDILDDYENTCRVMYVEFREKYFSRPWVTISLIVAVLVLLLTLVQTGYAVASYHQQEILK